MIYDTVDHLYLYTSISEPLHKVPSLLQEHWDDGSYVQHGLRIEVSTHTTKQFSHLFTLYRGKTVFYTVLEGSELVVTSYRGQPLQIDDKGSEKSYIEGGGVANLVQTYKNRFLIFLPGEPFCTSLSSDAGPTEVRTMMIILD